MTWWILLTSGDVKAVLTVHHFSVDPEAVSCPHVTQTAVAHRTLAQTQAQAHSFFPLCLFFFSIVRIGFRIKNVAVTSVWQYQLFNINYPVLRIYELLQLQCKMNWSTSVKCSMWTHCWVLRRLKLSPFLKQLLIHILSVIHNFLKSEQCWKWQTSKVVVDVLSTRIPTEIKHSLPHLKEAGGELRLFVFFLCSDSISRLQPSQICHSLQKRKEWK